MHDPYFFGYGSLVNRQTHDYTDAHRAAIRGWRREWRVSRRLNQTFLSVVPDPDTRIDGLIARVPGADWAALDLRETGYDRHPVAHENLHHDSPVPVIAQIYAVALDISDLPGPSHRVNLSYLDVVVAGFLAEFGTDGVARFFETTTGWGAVLDDRAAPIYPRARPATKELRDMVDDSLSQLGVQRSKV
ncbi:gamma-glutamylcyclotransferase family protein [Roseinatronobacter alkalisoli]|uniref:glutathione-specific gamma-glutamylcyclotransferase n=1 Tax=Roseinatronobacter alkalisoli TaxID=3028235 RepID=A0ABT5T5Y0_9RHOB|nr:gamma-glutamylcyclotransferase family protein [Roseinatronobacter sp. HJB301]MDD7970498.1 gamma-glutamylcyclotransferase [Roseinatronobacter sp. HJB301]